MRSYDLRAVRALIADDSRHMRLVLRKVLASLGITMVGEAENGEQALGMLSSFAPDVLIADWEMGPVNGLELVRRIRAAEEPVSPYIPIIMLTAYTEAFRLHLARDAGISEYLAKPVSARGLYARLVNAIESTRQFVRCGHYMGPCRRRSQNRALYAGAERRVQLRVA